MEGNGQLDTTCHYSRVCSAVRVPVSCQREFYFGTWDVKTYVMMGVVG